MILTLENLFFGVTSIYAFTTISTDAASSVQRNRCGLEVHDLKVDLYQELALIWRELVEPAAREAGIGDTAGNMTAKQVLDALDRPTELSVLDFHGRLNELFSRLYDAHTRYRLELPIPITQTLPLEFSLAAAEEGAAQPPKVLARRASEESEKLKEVTAINGRPPLTFLQRIADRRALYLDEGQRLNALLLGDILGSAQQERGLTLKVANECDLVGPGDAVVNVSFADGSEMEAKWKVQLRPNTTEFLLELGNPDYVDIMQLDADKLALRQEQLKVCESMPGCSSEKLQEVLPHGPIERQAVSAYRRLFGALLSEETLGQLVMLRSSRAKSNVAMQDNSALPDEASRAPALAGAHSGSESDDEGVEYHSSEHPRLRGAARSAMTSSTSLDKGDQKGEQHLEEDEKDALVANSSNASNIPEDVDGVEACLANYSHLAPGGSVEVLFAPTIPGLGVWMAVMGVGDMVVIKMMGTGFQPSDMAVAMKGYQIAVDYARKKGIRRALLDFVGNAGGLVSVSDLFQSLLLKVYDARELCLDRNKKVNEYWRQWIISFGSGLDSTIRAFAEQLRQKAQKVSLQVGKWLAQWHLKHLSIIVKASAKVLQLLASIGLCESSFNTGRIHRWIRVVNSAKTKGDLLRFMERIMWRQEFVPDCLFAELEGGEGVGGRSGWYPFLGNDLVERSSLRPFPNLTGLLDPVRQKWGDGRDAGQRYSQRGPTSGCLGSVASLANLQRLTEEGNPDLRPYRDHPFEDIAILSDGLAGSSGSVLQTKLMVSGYVTAFTYGGNGKVMDSSSYSGGNVLEYAGWWRQSAVAAEMGMWLAPHSSWEGLSRALNLTSDLSGAEAVIYPRPMPSAFAQAAFTFDIMYVPEWDVEGDETQLPRQFYRLPAHKNYNIWPRDLLKVCGNPEGLLEIYKRVQQEDWWEVRRRPKHLGDGLSSVCLPDALHGRCCAACHAPSEGACDGPGDPNREL